MRPYNWINSAAKLVGEPPLKNTLMISVRHFLLAVQFFTRIPIEGRLAQWVGYSPAMLRASAAHFPAVGALVGGMVALLAWVLFALLPQSGAATAFVPLVAAIFTTIASVLITGAFHEDGLADVADGLGGSSDRDKALAIMKDSRVGAFGAVALVLAIVGKVALLGLLGSIGWQLMCCALFGAHVVSRAAPLVLIRAMVHVSDDATSKSKPLADQISAGSLLVAGLWTCGALILMQFLQPDINWWVPLLTTLFALVWMWRLFWRRLKGFTGDCLGATQQVCELAFYFGLAVSL